MCFMIPYISLALFVIVAPCKKAFRFSKQCAPRKPGLIGCSLSVLFTCPSVLYIYYIPHSYFMQLDQIDLWNMACSGWTYGVKTSLSILFCLIAILREYRMDFNRVRSTVCLLDCYIQSKPPAHWEVHVIRYVLSACRFKTIHLLTTVSVCKLHHHSLCQQQYEHPLSSSRSWNRSLQVR